MWTHTNEGQLLTCIMKGNCGHAQMKGDMKLTFKLFCLKAFTNMCLHMQSQAHLEPLGPDTVHARCQAASRQALGVIQVLHRQGLLCWRKDGAEPGPC